MRRCLGLVLIFGAVLLAAGCGGDLADLSARTERFRVRLTVDRAAVGERTAFVEVRDGAGFLVAAEEVVLAPAMPAMGHAMPALRAEPVQLGRFRAQGTFFSMAGDWEVDVVVRAGGHRETARFSLAIG